MKNCSFIYIYIYISVLHSFSQWLGGGFRDPKRGCARGAVPPAHKEIFETRIPTNAFSWHPKWLLCIHQTATFVQILGMGGGQISYLQTNGFFHPTRKVNWIECAITELNFKYNYFLFHIVLNWTQCEKTNIWVTWWRQLNPTLILQTAVFTVWALGSVNESPSI